MLLVFVLAALAPVAPAPPTFDHDSYRQTAYYQDARLPRYGPNVLEVALEEESFWAFYGRRFAADDGYAGLGFLGSDEDEQVINARFLRYGKPVGDPPFALGVGLGVYAAEAEVPDKQSFAVALMGSIETRFDSGYPVRLVLEGAYAPDVSTFGDGDQVVDLWARVELELSDIAQFFVGYRVVELQFDDGTERDLGESVQVGVRLGF